jgi:sugar lactone lactonase YvrE
VQETLSFGGDADNVRYDEQTGNIWVGYGDGGLAMTNAAGQNIGSIALGTHPESFQFEQTEIAFTSMSLNSLESPLLTGRNV